MIRTAALTTLLLATTPAHACIGRFMPMEDQPELYSDIIVAEVTAVEITRGIIPAGFPPTHNLTVKIRETIKGDMAGTVILTNISGCGVPVPEVGQWTTFYLQDKHVVPGLYHTPKKLNERGIFEEKKSDG